MRNEDMRALIIVGEDKDRAFSIKLQQWTHGTEQILGTQYYGLYNRMKNVKIFITKTDHYYMSSNIVRINDDQVDNIYNVNYDDGDLIAEKIEDDILYELCCVINKFAYDNELDLTCSITIRECEWNK